MKRFRSILKIAAVFMAALLASCFEKANSVVFEIPDGYHGPLFVVIDKSSGNQIEIKDGKYIVPFNKYGFSVLKEAEYRNQPFREYASIGNASPERVLLPAPDVNDHGKDVRFYDITNMDNPLDDGRGIILMYYGTSDEALNFSQSFAAMDIKAYFKQKWPEYFDKTPAPPSVPVVNPPSAKSP